MNFRSDRKQLPDLNLTPLIDVVFLLLIFFMVSTTFDKESRIKIELPQAATQDERDTQDTVLDITIDASGRFYVNQNEVINTELDTLMRAIAKAVKDRRDLPVIISADANTPHHAVIRAMDAASQLGFVNMTFTARKPVETK
jgi:biopolymer transport protein ExbD